MAGSRRSRRATRKGGKKGSPYFFRRVWSPFGAGVKLVGNTANVGLGFVDNTARGSLGLVRSTARGAIGGVGKIGYGVASAANNAVGGLVGRNRSRRNRNRSNRNRK
jgi:hypothetical protein